MSRWLKGLLYDDGVGIIEPGMIDGKLLGFGDNPFLASICGMATVF